MTKKAKQQTEEIQKISFEDIKITVKLFISLFGFIEKIMERIERSKNEREKQKLLKAITDGDADTINSILFK